MPDAAPSFTGSIPGKYDRYLGPYIFQPYAVDVAARINPAGLHAVLETACGTGRLTALLRHVLLPGTRLVATDLNADMLAVAKSNLPGGNIEWMTADAQSLPFDDNCFDLVVCQFGLMFMPDKPLALREAFRVLKPGGRLLISTWDKLENNPAMFLANQIVAGFFPVDPPQFFHLPFSLFDEQALIALCKDAGFNNISATLVKKPGTSPSVRDTVTGMLEGSPVVNAINERGPELLPAIQQSLGAALAKAFGDMPMVSPLQAWVIEAYRH